MLAIKRLLPEDTATSIRWDEFVMKCDEATFFHRAGWQLVIRDVFRHDTFFLYAESDGCIQGVLPLAHITSLLFGSSLVGLPFAVYGGVAASNAQAVEALEVEAQRLARHLDVRHLELRNVIRRHTDWPVQDLYVTFRKPILPLEESNMSGIPRKQRAMIRKGIKNNLVSHIDSNVDRFFGLYAGNVHRHGTPALPKIYFTTLAGIFGPDCEVLTVTNPQGRPLSSVLSFYFRDEVLPYYAGDEPAARDLSANDFKYWELMRRSCARGLKTFDFGRSKQGTGSYHFKRNWGFEPTPLHYEHCLYRLDTLPQNNPSNPKYRALIETWRRLPIGVANWLGPFVVRSLG